MTMLYKVLAVAALIAAIIFGYKAWEHHIDQQGYKRANGEWELKETQIKADAAEKLAAATKDTLVRQSVLNRALLNDAEQQIVNRTRYEKKIATLRAAARAGALKLSIAIDTRSLPKCAPGADTVPASGLGGETRADVMPGAADRIIGIAAASARDVHDFNRIQNLYNAAREACNAESVAP